MSRLDLIVRGNARTLDKIDKGKLERHLQKPTKSAQTSIVRGNLQQDRVQFLLKVNNEAKVRRSTKSIVLGKAKVMSFEDLVKARTKRAEKETNDLAKNRRSRGRSAKTEYRRLACQTR